MLTEKQKGKLCCRCHNVTYGRIYEAVQNGARTADEVAQATGTSTGCGKCREFLECLVREFAEDVTDLSS